MTTVGFISKPQDAQTIVAWTKWLSQGKEAPQLLCLENPREQTCRNAAREALEQDNGDTPDPVSTSSTLPIPEVVEACRKAKARRLVTGTFKLESQGKRPQTSDELVLNSPCETYLLLHGEKLPSAIRKILVITTGGSHDRSCLRLADQFMTRSGAKATVATIEEENDASAAHAGERSLRSLLHDAELDADQFEIKVAVDRLPHRGVMSCFDEHDLVICGRDGASWLRPLRTSLNGATALLVKRPPPLVIRSLPDWLPRIHPRDHAELLHDMRQGSRWNVDFVVMLALASAIATLGLMQNSPAVVIGSMLLAPLMTPMIGAGLALSQANMRLAKRCGRTILLGFFLTLGVSLILGMITPSRETLSPEVLARGGPNVLDLLIAFFSALAATFAMARPNIIGAVAGVAIATALVPPVCAAGLSLSMAEFDNAYGALLLFATNLVAIIAASSYTYFLLGVTSVRSLPRHRRVSRLIRASLLVLLVLLIGPLSYEYSTQLGEGRQQSAVHPVTRDLSRTLHEHVAKTDGVEIIFLGKSAVTDHVVIQIASERELPLSYADNLRAIVRETMGAPEQEVVIAAVRGYWRSDVDGDDDTIGAEAPATDPEAPTEEAEEEPAPEPPL